MHCIYIMRSLYYYYYYYYYYLMAIAARNILTRAEQFLYVGLRIYETMKTFTL